MHHFTKLHCEDRETVSRYLSVFEGGSAYKRIGEAAPDYFWTTDRSRSPTQPPSSVNPDIPGSVKRVLGDDLSLILSLRHPVDRAISAYGHHARYGRIHAEGAFAENAERLGILDLGLYSAHLRAWQSVFDPNNFLILLFEDSVKKDPLTGYQTVCRFLDVSPDFTPKKMDVGLNIGTNRVGCDSLPIEFSSPRGPLRIGPRDVDFLLSYYEADIRELASMIAPDLSSWHRRSSELSRLSTTA